MDNSKADFFSLKNILLVFGIAAFYLLLSYLLIGFKTDQLILSGLFLFCYFLSSHTRKFILGFAIFIVYWIIFDYMKAFPNYNFNEVHIADLYNAEKQLFGIRSGATTITANEYWAANSTNWLDVLTGSFYLCWIPVPLGFAAYLFFKDKAAFLRFSLTFVFVNLLGFVIYYTYPAAPPWYYFLHGNQFIADTMGNTAGLHRFDDYFGITVFQNLYQKGSNVFAAMPSLHSAYPIIVFYYGLRKKLGWVNILFAIVMTGIWFSAVYTSHHYILDVLAGILCAAIGIFLFDKLLLRSKAFQRFLKKYETML